MSCNGYERPKARGSKVINTILLLAIIAMVISIIVALSTPARAMDNEPTGIAGIPWGSGVSEFTNAGIRTKHVIDSPAGIAYYVVENGMPKLGAIVISLLFVDKELIAVMRLFPGIKALTNHAIMLMVMHGKPDSRDEYLMEWRGKNTLIQASSDNFGVMHIDAGAAPDLINRLDKDVRGMREQKKNVEKAQLNKDALHI